MPSSSSEFWRAVGPYLDQALDMPEEERSVWLAQVREQNPEMAATLEKLLQEHRELAQEQFLEHSPIPPGELATMAGQTVGAYTLLSPIGQGGMSSVWLAERSDGRFDRRVAVKFLNLSLLGRAGGERFRREGSILGLLAHANIAELLDAGVSAAGQPYLVLEHVDGEPIDHYCDGRQLAVERRVRLFLDVLAAVAHAHGNLIVHRDIKPSNVLVRVDGQVKLLDFGIAKLLEEERQAAAATLLTLDGGSVLTPEYAAPEQVTGRAVTTATDVYGLGVLLYVLLSGQHPAGPGPHSPAKLVEAIVHTEPPRLSQAVADTGKDPESLARNAALRSSAPDKLRRSLAGDLDTIVGKALKKEPGERYSSVTAFADDLKRYLAHQPIAARPDTLGYRAAKFVRRNRVVVALALLAVIGTLAGVAGTLVQAHTARQERDFALRQLSRAEAINELNTFLLSDAAPSGKPFTVNELLARAQRLLERSQGTDEASRVELLVSIGRQYDTQDMEDKARPLLEQAYQLARGLPEPSTRAKASCALASVLSRQGELGRAEALFQEGLQQLPAQPQFVFDRTFCLQRGREVAARRGQYEEAISRIVAAQQVMSSSPFRSDLLELSIFMDLAEAYRDAGKLREADEAFREAARRLSQMGRDDTERAGTLYQNWGLAVDQMGRPRDAEALLRRAIAISQASQSGKNVPPMILVNYARVLRNLNRLPEAARYAERGYAEAQTVGESIVVDQALLMRARIYRDQHDMRRSQAMLAEVEPRLRKNLPPGHIGFAALLAEKAANAEALGDSATAWKLANQALEMAEASHQEEIFYLSRFLFVRSDIELQLNRPREAAADAERVAARVLATIPPGTSSRVLGEADLRLGEALEAQGRTREANSEFQAALKNFQDTLPPDHPQIQLVTGLLRTEQAH